MRVIGTRRSPTGDRAVRDLAPVAAAELLAIVDDLVLTRAADRRDTTDDRRSRELAMLRPRRLTWSTSGAVS